MLEKIVGKSGYATVLDECEIKVGGKKGKFVPNINASKWNDECWLNINHPDVVMAEKEIERGGEVEIEIEGKKHKYYVKDEKLEYGIEFENKPLTNEVKLDLVFPPGLNFWYQGELTQQEKDEGFERPEDVVDSYAVYWKRKNNQYKTGKFCHIYRVKIVDKNRNWTWCKQNIVGKLWTIIIPQQFLDNAIYPVILDPILGYSIAGASSAHAYTTLRGSIDQTDADGGNIKRFHMAISSVDPSDKRHLLSVCNVEQTPEYDPSGKSPVEIAEIDPCVVSDDNWVDAPVGNNIPGNTWFFLAIKSPSTNTEHKFDSGILHYWSYSATVYEIPDPLPTLTYGAYYALSVWVDYQTLKSVLDSGSGMDTVSLLKKIPKFVSDVGTFFESITKVFRVPLRRPKIMDVKEGGSPEAIDLKEAVSPEIVDSRTPPNSKIVEGK